MDVLADAVEVAQMENRMETVIDSASAFLQLSSARAGVGSARGFRPKSPKWPRTPVKKASKAVAKKGKGKGKSKNWDHGLSKPANNAGALRRMAKQSELFMLDCNKVSTEQPATELSLHTENYTNYGVISFKVKGVGLTEFIRGRKSEQMREIQFGDYRPIPVYVDDEHERVEDMRRAVSKSGSDSDVSEYDLNDSDDDW
jgi:hypothetical protein